jgi:hypothetical protein
MAKTKNVKKTVIPYKVLLDEGIYNDGLCDDDIESSDNENENSDSESTDDQDLADDVFTSSSEDEIYESLVLESDTGVHDTDNLNEKEESERCEENKEEFSKKLKNDVDQLIAKTVGSSFTSGSDETIISNENQIDNHDIQKKSNVTLLDLTIQGKKLIAHRPSDCETQSSSSTHYAQTKTKKPNAVNEEKLSKNKVKNSKRKRVKDISADCKLAVTGTSGHVEITVPNELEILSVIVKTGTGMKNGIVLPLGNSQFRKLCNCSMEPKRIKTLTNWTAIQSMYFFSFNYYSSTVKGFLSISTSCRRQGSI